jgi:hypothetical protein
VSDPAGVSAVVLNWRVGSTTGSAVMSRRADGRWGAAFGHFPHGTLAAGRSAGVISWITARDRLGHESTSGTSPTSLATLHSADLCFG